MATKNITSGGGGAASSMASNTNDLFFEEMQKIAIRNMTDDMKFQIKNLSDKKKKKFEISFGRVFENNQNANEAFKYALGKHLKDKSKASEAKQIVEEAKREADEEKLQKQIKNATSMMDRLKLPPVPITPVVRKSPPKNGGSKKPKPKSQVSKTTKPTTTQKNRLKRKTVVKK